MQLSIEHAHHESIRPLIELERDLVRAESNNPDLVSEMDLAVIRHAVSTARMRLIRLDDGTDLNVAETLQPFRRWLTDVVNARAPRLLRTKMGYRDLLKAVGAIQVQVRRARSRVLARHLGRLSKDRLDLEVREKKLVVVLGGGGGAGFAHLGAMSLLHSIGWRPGLIVGASMGSLVGLLRSIHHEWDPMGTLVSMPRRFDLNNIFHPVGVAPKFGFPGVLGLRLRGIGRTVFEMLTRQSTIPSFNGLRIPLEVVVTGIRRGFPVDMSDMMGRDHNHASASLTGRHLRRRLFGMARLIRRLTMNPQFLQELVFGRDPLTRKCSVIDAVGFSCAVPGIFSYDLAEDVDRDTVHVIETLFAQHKLWGMMDGGVVNNVPSRVAWESVQSGTVHSRNAFVYSLDAFAPRVNANMMFIPVQRLARKAVSANNRFSDLYKAYTSPPSPIHLTPGWRQLRTVIRKTRQDLERDREFLTAMSKPLLPWQQIDGGS